MAPSRVSNADSEGSSSADVSMAEADTALPRPAAWNSKFATRVSPVQPVPQPPASGWGATALHFQPGSQIAPTDHF
jgi:hypothetical protein